MQPFCGGRSGQCAWKYFPPGDRSYFKTLLNYLFQKGLFHLRSVQTTFSDRRASYVHRQELSLSSLHTGGKKQKGVYIQVIFSF